MLSHKNIWKAIDLLAQRNGLSASGLAIKAGLSSTLFNPSKRATAKRERWPSTESIAAILKATQTSLEDFVALISPTIPYRNTMPLLSFQEAAGLKDGKPTSDIALLEKSDKMPLPGSCDEQAFAIEIADKSYEPTYHEGDIAIVSHAEKLRRGDHVVVKLATGELLIRQMGREGAQKIELMPITPDASPTTLARQDVAWAHRIVWVSK